MSATYRFTAINNDIDTTLHDFQCRDMMEEIIPDHEAEEDKVIDCPHVIEFVDRFVIVIQNSTLPSHVVNNLRADFRHVQQQEIIRLVKSIIPQDVEMTTVTN